MNAGNANRTGRWRWRGRVFAMLGLGLVSAPAAWAQFSPNFDIVEAVEEENLQEARTLLLRGATANARDGAGVPILLLAAGRGDADMIDMLLDNGASVDLATRDTKVTALMDRAAVNDLVILQKLIDHGADLDKADRSGETALMRAARIGHFDTVELLLENGADPGIADYSGRTARDYAIGSRERAIARLLSDHGG